VKMAEKSGELKENKAVQTRIAALGKQWGKGKSFIPQEKRPGRRKSISPEKNTGHGGRGGGTRSWGGGKVKGGGGRSKEINAKPIGGGLKW